MQVEAVPLTDFLHGELNAHAGVPRMIEAGLAQDLESAGLVRIKFATGPFGRGVALLGKVFGVGRDASPSALPADPVSPAPIAEPSKPGARSPHKGAK